MDLVALATYIHELRFKKTSRRVGYRMDLNEVISAVLDCQTNGISQVIVQTSNCLPQPLDGIFSRLRGPDGKMIARVLVRDTHPAHWQEFVAIKELMHCWSPSETFVGSQEAASQLVEDLSALGEINYTPDTVGDVVAISAAAEVMLPLSTLMQTYSIAHDHIEVAHRHNLNASVAKLFCHPNILFGRSNRSL